MGRVEKYLVQKVGGKGKGGGDEGEGGKDKYD